MAWFLRLPPGAYLDEATNSIRGVEDPTVPVVDEIDPTDNQCPTCGDNGCADCGLGRG